MPLLKRVPRWIWEALIVLTLLGLFAAFQGRNLAQGSAPDFALRDLSGHMTNASDLRGKPTLLVFWAPWCGVCRAMGSNVSWVKSLHGGSANVVSVASDYSSVDEVRAYASEHGIDYPVLLGGRETARAFGVRAYPSVFVLDERGAIRTGMVGYASTLGMALRLWWYGESRN
jgi:thiol-disulfide isomerase/thioredoxin